MKKFTKLMALLLAVATMFTITTPSRISAAEQLTGTIAKNAKYVKIAEGQELGDAIKAAETGIKASNASANTSSSIEAGTIPTGNDYTYIGVLEDSKKRQVYIRIPYWFADAFPNTKWYLTKKALQVKITVKPKKGLGGKKFTKSVKLGRDSRYWLGGFGDYENEMIVPPWIQKIFKEEKPIITAGTDETLGACQTIVIKTWKNKSAKNAKKNPIVKIINFVNYNHYRVTTTNRYNGGGDNGGVIIID